MDQRAAIKAIRSFLPERELTNEQLAAEFVDWDAQKIYDKTGIRSRRVAEPEQCSSDLGVAAAERLFETGACSAQDVDFLLFCTESPDYFLPPNGCLVQERLALRRDCGALDINQGCAGFVYGLALAKGLVETGAAANVLLITAETYSKLIEPHDRAVRTIFGDGAAATLISGVQAEHDPIGPFVFGTDGRGASNLIVRDGAFRHPGLRASGEGAEGDRPSPASLHMNGPEVFTFTLQAVPQAVRQLLKRSALTGGQVDQYVFHQANRFMLDRLRAKLDIPAERFWIDMEYTGNTVSSTIPIALEAAHARGTIRPGDTLMLVGFGLGYSWAATMVRWA